MTKEEYLKLYEKEAEELPLTDEDVIEWLDSMIARVKEYNEAYFDLMWGKLDYDEGEYEHKIMLCSPQVSEIHIYTGIDELARILKEEVQKEYFDNKYDKYFFPYNEFTIFELKEK